MENEPDPGSRVEVTTSDGVYVGVVLPRPELSEDDHLIVKLDNGYNIGVEKKRIKKIKVIEKAKKQGGKEKKKSPAKGKPPVTIISTGGTISSKVDYRTGGVYASYTAEDLIEAAPELSDLAEIKSLFLMNVMSEDMNPPLWQKIAKAAAKEMNSGKAGVVVTHGTDTMHYTTAALSFMLPELGKPVVVTGAQRSTDRGSSDSFLNLICSTAYAVSNTSGVTLIMHGSLDDTHCHAHSGTKVRKMHTSRRDAFKSINAKPLARVFPDGRVDVLSSSYPTRCDGTTKTDLKLDERVALIKAYPGMDPDVVDFYIDQGVRGIVFEGTALGHLPTSIKDTSLLPKVERAREEGVVLAMATQCLYGRVHPLVYTNLRELSSRGVIYCEDMLPETAYVKLMWVLGHTKDCDEARVMMLTNYACELTERSTAFESVPGEIF